MFDLFRLCICKDRKNRNCISQKKKYFSKRANALSGGEKMGLGFGGTSVRVRVFNLF